jgi:hypothetical protein
LRALGERAMPAVMAIQPRHMMMQRHTLTNLEAARTRTDSHDRACCFVFKYARRRDAAVLDFFYVGRADTARRDFDQQFTRAEARHRKRLNPEVIYPATHHRPHRFGNLK